MAILQNEVINYLLGLIEQSGHDAPLPSQNELRQKFACSTVTVRKALEKLEERGLIYRLQGKGCFVRRPEQKSPATRIFLIIPQGADLQGEFISSLVAASRKYSYHNLRSSFVIFLRNFCAREVNFLLCSMIYPRHTASQNKGLYCPHPSRPKPCHLPQRGRLI